MDGIYKNFQEVEDLGLYGGWGRTLHPTFVIASCDFEHVWSCVVVLKEDFTNIFVRPNSSET
jgi:hypothetical protein